MRISLRHTVTVLSAVHPKSRMVYIESQMELTVSDAVQLRSGIDGSNTMWQRISWVPTIYKAAITRIYGNCSFSGSSVYTITNDIDSDKCFPIV